MNKPLLVLFCVSMAVVTGISGPIVPAFAQDKPADVEPAEVVAVAVEKVQITTERNKKIEPTFTYRTALLNQLGRGVGNVLYAAFEVPYRIKNEIRDVDPFRGIVPGAIKGVSWAVARAAIGVFEIVTFYAPRKSPYIEDFDTDWLYA